MDMGNNLHIIRDTFGGRLEALRLYRGYNQKEVVDRLLSFEVTENFDKAYEGKRRTYHNWEIDKTKPSIDNMELLCKILDCDCNYLLGKINTPHDNRAITDVTGLSYDSIEFLYIYKDKKHIDIMNKLLTNTKFGKLLENLMSLEELEEEYINTMNSTEKDYIPGRITDIKDKINVARYNASNQLNRIMDDFTFPIKTY